MLAGQLHTFTIMLFLKQTMLNSKFGKVEQQSAVVSVSGT